MPDRTAASLVPRKVNNCFLLRWRNKQRWCPPELKLPATARANSHPRLAVLKLLWLWSRCTHAPAHKP